MTIKRSLPFYLIGFYPVALILGTLISEILTLFLIALYIYDCINDKKKFIYNDPIIYFLMIIWIYLLFNLIYSIDFQLSFYRSIFFIRYPLLILSITHFLTKDPQNSRFFIPSSQDNHHLFDLPGFVLSKLSVLGLSVVQSVSEDTYADETKFYSYRRATHTKEADYGRCLSAIILKNDLG